MGEKKYTVLVFSQQASKVKKFILSPLALKVGVGTLGLLLGLSAYLIYDYLRYQKKVFDLKELRTEINSQQAEIQSFLEKISLLEEQLSRVKLVEEQVKKDLKEVQELRKERKVKRLPSSSPVSSAKTPKLPKVEESQFKASSFRWEKGSILEGERPRLVSRLHLELLELSNEALQREHNLMQLREFLQAQKSVLLSIPSLWPVLGRITSPFGATRISNSSGGTRPHMGLDIGAPIGTPVIAPADGTVIFAGRESEYGRLISIDHGHGFTTRYGHLREMHVKTGERVRMGQTIGSVGTSGSSTGPHLHYEVRIQGKPTNPRLFLNRVA
jgi:murein DD-endopeptidase MepM/ murein hydrolase activator NlpD